MYLQVTSHNDALYRFNFLTMWKKKYLSNIYWTFICWTNKIFQASTLCDIVFSVVVSCMVSTNGQIFGSRINTKPAKGWVPLLAAYLYFLMNLEKKNGWPKYWTQSDCLKFETLKTNSLTSLFAIIRFF